MGWAGADAVNRQSSSARPFRAYMTTYLRAWPRPNCDSISSFSECNIQKTDEINEVQKKGLPRGDIVNKLRSVTCDGTD
jgi:hypothetical protein